MNKWSAKSDLANQGKSVCSLGVVYLVPYLHFSVKSTPSFFMLSFLLLPRVLFTLSTIFANPPFINFISTAFLDSATLRRCCHLDEVFHGTCGGDDGISGTASNPMLFVERDRGIRDTGGRLSRTLAMAGNVVLREIGGLVSRELGGSATKLEVSGVAVYVRYGIHTK